MSESACQTQYFFKERWSEKRDSSCLVFKALRNLLSKCLANPADPSPWVKKTLSRRQTFRLPNGTPRSKTLEDANGIKRWEDEGLTCPIAVQSLAKDATAVPVSWLWTVAFEQSPALMSYGNLTRAGGPASPLLRHIIYGFIPLPFACEDCSNFNMFLLPGQTICCRCPLLLSSTHFLGLSFFGRSFFQSMPWVSGTSHFMRFLYLRKNSVIIAKDEALPSNLMFMGVPCLI